MMWAALDLSGHGRLSMGFATCCTSPAMLKQGLLMTSFPAWLHPRWEQTPRAANARTRLTQPGRCRRVAQEACTLGQIYVRSMGWGACSVVALEVDQGCACTPTSAARRASTS